MYFLCASIAVYLDGVSVTVTVSAQLRRSQCDASLNGFRLAREVAQVELCIGEQILTTRIRHVVNPIAQAWKRESAQQSWNQLFQSSYHRCGQRSELPPSNSNASLPPQVLNDKRYQSSAVSERREISVTADQYEHYRKTYPSIQGGRRGSLWRWREPDRNASCRSRRLPLAGCDCDSSRSRVAPYCGLCL